MGAFGDGVHGGDAASTKIKSSHEKSARTSKCESGEASRNIRTSFYRVRVDTLGWTCRTRRELAEMVDFCSGARSLARSSPQPGRPRPQLTLFVFNYGDYKWQDD